MYVCVYVCIVYLFYVLCTTQKGRRKKKRERPFCSMYKYRHTYAFLGTVLVGKRQVCAAAAGVVLYSWRQRERKQMHAPSQEKGKGTMRCTGALWRLCVCMYVFVLFLFLGVVWCGVEKGGWPTTAHSNASRSSRCSSSSPSPSSTISIMAGMTGCPCWIFQYPSITIGAA